MSWPAASARRLFSERTKNAITGLSRVFVFSTGRYCVALRQILEPLTLDIGTLYHHPSVVLNDKFHSRTHNFLAFKYYGVVTHMGYNSII